MKRQQPEDDSDNKEIRRKKFQERNTFKGHKNEPTISHYLKKELQKKKQEFEEDDWEEWERHYNR